MFAFCLSDYRRIEWIWFEDCPIPSEKGARHLILVGRQGAVKEEAQPAIASLTEQGVNVDIQALDVSDPVKIQQLIDSLQNNKILLKGIIHAATVYEDAFIKNLDTQKIDNVFAAKVKGAWNLHQSTRNLSLDFFVVYSSVTTLLEIPDKAITLLRIVIWRN